MKRSIHVLWKGHTPSMKPIWPPRLVVTMTTAGFCRTILSGIAAVKPAKASSEQCGSGVH